MTRTTIDIDAVVLRTLRSRARRDRLSMGQLASELLAVALESDPAPRDRVRWHSQPMEPRIDIDDKDALNRALDGR